MSRRATVSYRPNPILHRIQSLSLTPSDSSAGDSSSSSSDNTSNINPNNSTNGGIDTTGIDMSFDPRLYKVRLSRATGIEYVSLLLLTLKSHLLLVVHSD